MEKALMVNSFLKKASKDSKLSHFFFFFGVFLWFNFYKLNEGELDISLMLIFSNKI